MDYSVRKRVLNEVDGQKQTSVQEKVENISIDSPSNSEGSKDDNRLECFYSIPEDTLESEMLDKIAFDTHNKIVKLLDSKGDQATEAINKLLEMLDNTRRVYTSLALFNKIKFRVIH